MPPTTEFPPPDPITPDNTTAFPPAYTAPIVELGNYYADDDEIELGPTAASLGIQVGMLVSGEGISEGTVVTAINGVIVETSLTFLSSQEGAEVTFTLPIETTEFPPVVEPSALPTGTPPTVGNVAVWGANGSLADGGPPGPTAPETTPTAGNMANWDAEGNLVDSGIAVTVNSFRERPRPPRMWVWDRAGVIHLDMTYQGDATKRLVVKASRNTGLNNIFNYTEIGLVTGTVTPGSTPTITALQSATDDRPGHYCAANTRAGGGHTCEIVKVTKASHGLTSSNKGNIFTDSAGKYFRVTDIISTSEFWMIPQKVTLIGDAGFTRYVPVGTPINLTGQSGQGNLTDVAVAFTTVGPVINAVQQLFLVNGRPLLVGEIVECDYFEMVEIHQVPDLAAAYDYWAVGAAGSWSAVGAMWERHIVERWLPWGQLTTRDTTRLVRDGMRMGEVLVNQFNPPYGVGANTHLHVWIPGAKSKTMNGATVNGTSNPVIAAGLPFSFASGTGTDLLWEGTGDSDIPSTLPDTVIQLTSGASGVYSTHTACHAWALDCTFGDGTPARRLTHTSESLRSLNSGRKFYPMNASRDSVFAAGDTFAFQAFRHWFATAGGEIVSFASQASGKWLFHIQWAVSPGAAFTVTAPSWLLGLRATANRQFRGVLTSYNASAGTFVITPSANGGQVILVLD